MPMDLCGTVYSRNNLALRGILALNAGHVDSGYEGPIAIRLINMRATPWTLALGEPIFTIAFQTLDVVPEEGTAVGRIETQDSMIARVRDTADSALSNALFDLYASAMETRLNEYRANTLAELERSGDKKWVQIDRMWMVLFNSGGRNLWAYHCHYQRPPLGSWSYLHHIAVHGQVLGCLKQPVWRSSVPCERTRAIKSA